MNHLIAGTLEVSNAGLNWGTVVAFIAFLGGAVTWVMKRLDKNRSRTEKFVGDQVQNVATILDVKLTSIQSHLQDQDSKLGDTRDRVIRLEGKINGHSAS